MVNFASEMFVRKLGAAVRKIPGRHYNFRDAGGNPVRVIGEATLYLQLPNERIKHRFNALVTTAWDSTNILVGLHTLVRWGIVHEAFPLLPKPSAGLGETEVNAICQGKKSPTFTISGAADVPGS